MRGRGIDEGEKTELTGRTQRSEREEGAERKGKGAADDWAPRIREIGGARRRGRSADRWTPRVSERGEGELSG